MDFMFSEIKPNGKYYLDNIDFEIPIRIQNKLKNEYFKNELDFYKKLEELTIKHTSYYLFPNNVCCFYPKVTEQIASKEYTCQISGAKIKKGENYYCYRPILENLTTNKVYTIKKSVIISTGYLEYLPQDLFTFEEWCQKLSEHYYREDDVINFYDFACNIGDNGLDLLEFDKDPLKRRKRIIFKQIKSLEKQELKLIKLSSLCIDKDKCDLEINKIKNKIKKLKTNL